MLHGENAFIMYVCMRVTLQECNYCKHISCGTSERWVCTTTDSPAERGWRLGRLHVQQHRGSGSEDRKGTSAGGSSTARKADLAAGK